MAALLPFEKGRIEGEASVQRDAGWWNCIKHIETPSTGEQQAGEFVPGALDGMETWPDDIDYIRRVRLEPGDTIALFSERALTVKEIERVREQATHIFPDHAVIVLAGGMRLGVLGPGE